MVTTACFRARSVLLVCLLLGFLVGSFPATASRVRPLNLEQMTERAERIFTGRCLDVRTERHAESGLEVTVATFAVDQVLKGRVGETIRVRMLANPEPTATRGGVAGMPYYHPGEDVILFLYEESSRGLTSPVGMTQGSFLVQHDKQGRAIALNGTGNRSLFRGLSGEVAARWAPVADRGSERRGIPPRVLREMVDALQR